MNPTLFPPEPQPLEVQDQMIPKYTQRGLESMSDAEIVSCILNPGCKTTESVDMGRKLLQRYGNLNAIARLGAAELVRHGGLTVQKAMRLIATFELGRRRQMVVDRPERCLSSQEAYRYLGPKIMDSPRELFIVMYMNKRRAILGDDVMFKGGVDHAAIDMKMILSQTLCRQASSIIIAHNHPSGNLDPSTSDISITRKLKASCELMEIELSDHLIITQSGYFSFTDSGIM